MAACDILSSKLNWPTRAAPENVEKARRVVKQATSEMAYRTIEKMTSKMTEAVAM